MSGVDLRHSASVTLQGLQHSINDGLEVDAGRCGTDRRLLHRPGQLTGVEELSCLGHCRSEVILGNVDTYMPLEFHVEDSIHELTTQQ